MNAPVVRFEKFQEPWKLNRLRVYFTLNSKTLRTDDSHTFARDWFENRSQGSFSSCYHDEVVSYCINDSIVRQKALRLDMGRTTSCSIHLLYSSIEDALTASNVGILLERKEVMRLAPSHLDSGSKRDWAIRWVPWLFWTKIERRKPE